MKGLRKFKVDKDADSAAASDAGGESDAGEKKVNPGRKKPKATKE